MSKEKGRMYTEGEQLALTAHRDVPKIPFVRSFACWEIALALQGWVLGVGPAAVKKCALFNLLKSDINNVWLA